jgi:hypothetical protein
MFAIQIAYILSTKNLPIDFNFREKELGGWKKEKEFLEFRALAPKCMRE